MSDAFTQLVEDHAVTRLLRQMAVERLVGDAPEWRANLDAGELRIGGRRFPVDVVGTESHVVHTWVWAWPNPSFSAEQTAGSAALREYGARHGIDVLQSDEEIPLDVVSGELAGIAASAVAGADGFFVGRHEEGAVAFLLYDGQLANATPEPTDLPFALTRLLASAPFDVGRAVRSFAQHPAAGYEAAEHGGGLTLRGYGGAAVVRFDPGGGIDGIEVEVEPSGGGRSAAPEPRSRLVDRLRRRRP